MSLEGEAATPGPSGGWSMSTLSELKGLMKESLLEVLRENPSLIQSAPDTPTAQDRSG